MKAVSTPESPGDRPEPYAPGSALRMKVARAASGEDLAALTVVRDEAASKPAAIRQAEDRLLAAIRSRDLPNALILASVLVYMDPGNAIARRIKDRCAKQLDSARTRSFPRHDAIPRQRVPWSELSRRTLSRSEAYLLWCIDGRSTVEDIIDASAMPPLVAFETLDALLREGLIDLT